MLLALASAKPKVRTLILKSLDKGTIKILAQIAANILHGNIPLDNKRKHMLRKYHRVLSFLRNKYTPMEHKREALIQQGGFLPFLLPIISSVAGALISKAIK
jgi:hypothetical protein